MTSRSDQKLWRRRVPLSFVRACVVLTGKCAGDKLYIGTSTGTVQMYTLGGEGSSSKSPSSNARPRRIFSDNAGNAKLTKTITVSKRPVEQLGYLKDVNSLVVLSGSFLLFLRCTGNLPDYRRVRCTLPHSRTRTPITTHQGEGRLLLHHSHVRSAHLSAWKINNDIYPNSRILPRHRV